MTANTDSAKTDDFAMGYAAMNNLAMLRDMQQAAADGKLDLALDLATSARQAGITHTHGGVPLTFMEEDLLRRRTDRARQQVNDLLAQARAAQEEGNLNRVHAYYARALNVPHVDTDTRRYILAHIELLETAQALEDQPGAKASADEDLDKLLAQLLETIRSQKPNLFALLRLCAVPLWLDEDVMAVLRERDDGKEASILARLGRYSFFYRWTDRFTLSREARQYLLADWQDDRESFLDVNRRLLAYFDNRLAMNSPRDPVYYERLVQSQLYHTMIVDVQQGTRLLGRLFQQAQDNHRLAAARQYVLICKTLEPLLDPADYAYVTYFEARYHQLSDNRNAAYLLFEGLSRRPDLPSDLRARVLRGLGLTLVKEKQWVEGIEQLEGALGLFQAQGNDREAAYTMNNLGDAYLDLAVTTRGRGDHFEPLGHHMPLLSSLFSFGQLLARLPLVIFLIFALELPTRSLSLRHLGLGMDWAIARLFSDAILWYRRSRTFWQNQDDAEGLARVNQNLATLYLEINHPHQAWHGFDALLKAGKEDGLNLGTYRTARNQLHLAEAALRLGQFDEARQLLDEALPVFTDLRHHRRVAQTQERLGHLADVAQDWSGAMDAYTAGLRAWESDGDAEEVTNLLHRMESLSAAHPELPDEAAAAVADAQDRVSVRTYSIRYGHPVMQYFKRLAVLAFILTGVFVVMLGLRTESGSQIGADTALSLPIQQEKEGGFGPDVEYTLEQQIVPQADSNLTRNAPRLVGQTVLIYFLIYTLAGLYVIRTLSLGQIQANQRQRIVLDGAGISTVAVGGMPKTVAWADVVSLLRADRRLWRILLDSFSATAVMGSTHAVVIPGYTNHYEALMQWVHHHLLNRGPQPQDNVQAGPGWWRRLLSAATVDERVGPIPVYSAGFTVVRSKVGWVFLISALGLLGFVAVVLLAPDRLLSPLLGQPYALVDIYALLYLGIGLPLVYWFILQMAMWEMLLRPNGRTIWLLMGGGLAVTVLALTQAVILQLPLSRPDLVWASAAILILIFTIRALWTPRSSGGEPVISSGQPRPGSRFVHAMGMRLLLTGLCLMLLGLAGYAAGRELFSYADLVEGNRLLAQAETLRKTDRAEAIDNYVRASAAYDSSTQLWESPNAYNSLGAIYVQLGKFVQEDGPLAEPVYLCNKVFPNGRAPILADAGDDDELVDPSDFTYECVERTDIAAEDFFLAAVDSYELAWEMRPRELTYLLNVALTYQEWATALSSLAESEPLYGQALDIYTDLLARVQEDPRRYGTFEQRVREYRASANYNVASEIYPQSAQRVRSFPYFQAAKDDYLWILDASADPDEQAVGYAGLGWTEFYLRYQLPPSDVEGRDVFLAAAWDAFDRGIQANAQYAPLYNGLGWVEYYRVRDRSTRCNSSQPGEPERERYISGIERAITAFRNGVENDPNNGTFYRTLAQLNYILALCNPEYDRIDQLEISLGNYESALSIRPLAVWYYRQGTIGVALGDALKSAGRTDEAQARYELSRESLVNAIRQNPQEVEHWHWLYIVYGSNYLDLDRATLVDDILDAAQLDMTYANLLDLGSRAISRDTREYLGRRFLERAVEVNPTGAEALRLLGQDRFDEGDFAAALDYAQQAVDVAAIDSASLLLLGRSLLRLERYDESVAALETAAVLAPMDYDIHLSLGWAAYRAAQDELAVDAFDKAIRLAPDDPQPRFYQGLAYVALGDEDNAALAYRLAASVANGLGSSAARSDAYDEAFSDLLSVRVDPADLTDSMVDLIFAGLAESVMDAGGDMATFYAEEGAAALSAGRTAFAVRLLESARDLNPSGAQIYFDLGRAYLALGEREAALDALNTAVDLDPENPEARRLYGWTAYQLGQTDLAQTQMEAALALDGDNAQFLFNLGVIQAAQSNFEQAADTLSAGSELANQAPDRGVLDGLYAELVRNLRSARESFPDAAGADRAQVNALLDQISADYTRAQVYEQDDYRTFWLRGWYLYEVRLYELSAAMSARAVEISPEEPRVRFNQGLAELAAGQVDRATVSYAAGIEIAADFADGVARLNEALTDLRNNRDDPGEIATTVIDMLEAALATE